MTQAIQLLQQTLRDLNTNHKQILSKSHRMGLPVVVNSLFRLFFAMNSLKHCNTTIRCMKDYENKLHQFPISDAVTYKYYCGKFRILEENYVQAKNDLEFALKNCHKDHKR